MTEYPPYNPSENLSCKPYIEAICHSIDNNLQQKTRQSKLWTRLWLLIEVYSYAEMTIVKTKTWNVKDKPNVKIHDPIEFATTPKAENLRKALQ